MTDFFQFMFRDKDTAMGMGIFIIVVLYIVMGGLSDMMKRRGSDD